MGFRNSNVEGAPSCYLSRILGYLTGLSSRLKVVKMSKKRDTRVQLSMLDFTNRTVIASKRPSTSMDNDQPASKRATPAKLGDMGGKWDSRDNGALLVFTPDGIEPRNGTIVKTKSGNVFPRDTNDWQLWSPLIKSKLLELQEEGFKIVIFTNQRGIESGKVVANEFKRKITNVIKALNVKIQYRTKADHSCVDRLFASNLGVPFQTPENLFFGNSMEEPYIIKSFQPLQHFAIQRPKFEPEGTRFPYHDGTPEIVVLVGSPASGKSFLAKELASKHDYVIVNQDTLGTKRKCELAVLSALKERKNVVIDNTNRNPLTSLEMAEHNNAFRLIRGADEKHTSVNTMVLRNFFNQLQKPTKVEGFDDILYYNFAPQFDKEEDFKIYYYYLFEMLFTEKLERRRVINEAVGSAQNAFILATVISGLATLLLAGILPVMIGRLDTIHEQIVTEKAAFKELTLFVETKTEKRRRLMRQADFLDKLERRSFKGRMRMAGKQSVNVRPIAVEQFDRTQFLPPVQIFDRHIPRHTSEMKQQILSQIRALSSPTVQQRPIISHSNQVSSKIRVDSRCPRGPMGPKGRKGDDENGVDGAIGMAGLSYNVNHQRNADGCIVCPKGPQGPRGPKGKRGSLGAVGLPAPKVRGPPGPVGDIGRVGFPGTRGIQGPPGEVGFKFTKGLPGQKGVRGVRGDRGNEGNAGNVGDDGDVGDFGEDGTSGDSQPYCECPQRSPFIAPTELASNKVIPYYSYFRIL
ncbi:hypothetical protein M3Y96_00363600 [Aphelenchoides besseyi]|nr:hypothetical protein M3Y96_00363600 [Aphelenchoides besseyi]